MSIAALIFDLDETLITDDEATYEALQQTASYAEKQCDIDPEPFYRAAYSRAKQLWRAAPMFPFCNSLGISASEGMWGRFENDGSQWQELHDWVPGYQIAVWEHALSVQGHSHRALAEQLATIFREQRIASQELFPEAETVLQGLRSTYKLGILTNGAPDLQRQKIERSRLAHYFDAIVVSGEVGVGKPDPRVFTTVLEQLAVPAHATLMVGDSLERDMLGASQSGLKGIWINREGQSHNQHHAAHIHAQIANLDELYKIL
ncbi:MAG: HAD family hydrolase [Ktedonobacteraceae bacterium]|nr:HAD family hydrolase [Ktedonobacteraceae bacterium]